MNANSITDIRLDLLIHHPNNPRKELGDLTELADSIKASGIMQNLTVVPNPDREGTYLVVIGNRRMEASKLAGLETVPCVIAEMTEREQLATMLLENMQRSDLTVYEQAQGFQAMLDFGETVEDIASKTGFSKATVKRRLKMAELDGDVLKEVSVRQPSLEDFDKLSKIDDIKRRNILLKDIGTNNFNSRVEYALKEQAIAKHLPDINKMLRKLGAVKINRSQAWGGDYSRIKQISLVNFSEEEELVPSNEKRKLFYVLDDSAYSASLDIYVAVPKPPAKRRPQAEIDREHYIEESRERVTEATKIAYELRRKFVDGLRLTKANERDMLEGAASTIIAECSRYISRAGSPGLMELLGLKEDPNDSKAYSKRAERIKAAYNASPADCLPKVIYYSFGDSETNGYCAGYRYNFPTYQENTVLDALYDWLISLGYEMSDEEAGLRNGSSEMFKDKDKKGKNV